MLSNTSSDKESTSLPPPSSLFGSNYHYPTNNRSSYILPPPSSLPGYHLPPPHYQPPTPTPSPVEKKRKRRLQHEPLKKKKGSPSYHYEVLELKSKKTKQKRKGSEAAISAAAATLASFANTEEDEECIQLEACAGQGGKYECDYCGHNFKHLNCLQKHGWDHTEIHSTMTKQQQTQLIEAAQILMNIARYGMKIRMLQ